MVRVPTVTHRRGYTLVEILVTVFIFGILASLVVNNLNLVRSRNELANFTDDVYNFLKRAQTLALTGHTVSRCSDDLSASCTVATQVQDCASDVCTEDIRPVGWGVHYTSPVGPNPGVLRVYGDREVAQCGNWFMGFQTLACLSEGNGRFDLFSNETVYCNWYGVMPSKTDPLTCLTENNGDDVLDLDALGILTIPADFTLTTKRSDSIAMGGNFDVTFDITTGAMVVGSRNFTNHRDPTNLLSPAGNCNDPSKCYDAAASIVTVCTSLGSSGPYNRILVYPTGLVVNAGGGNSAC